MSEPIPEAVPTSSDRHSSRPTKRRALSPRSTHASSVSALFAKPDREIHIPSTALSRPKTNLAAPPEIVANVQGSSAGAGSGEFHVYKASRRREYERLRAMDDEVAREGEEKDFLARREEQERRDREKTERNRAKRAKALARKQKGKAGKTGEAQQVTEGEDKVGAKRKLPPRESAGVARDGEEDEGKAAEKEEVRIEEEIGLVIEDDD
ncbi:PRKR-interacting protein 1 [Stagonosporopsis vannaccii]|nr:PRKR-interacting protein 1 [Stagonosporopsis vannaccii]